MAPSKPRLFDIRQVPPSLGILVLKVTHRLPPVWLIVIYLDLAPLKAKLELLVSRSIKKIWFETDAMLIHSESVSEGLYVCIECRERQAFRDDANRSNCIPGVHKMIS